MLQITWIPIKCDKWILDRFQFPFYLCQNDPLILKMKLPEFKQYNCTLWLDSSLKTWTQQNLFKCQLLHLDHPKWITSPSVFTYRSGLTWITADDNWFYKTESQVSVTYKNQKNHFYYESLCCWQDWKHGYKK